MTPDAQSAVNAIRALKLNHENLAAVMSAAAAFAGAMWRETSADGMDRVSFHADAASDLCENVYMPSSEERAERERA